MLLNPYVAVFTARTSVTLLGYAALPWLLLCVHRGLRRPRSWWWPAAFALAVACTGGGVNAAVTAWVLLGPVLLALYEWLSRETLAARRAVVRLADRAADRARRALVGRADARAGALRRGLPALHRAAGDDLVDHQPARVAAADGLLDLLPRRRLRRAAAAAVRRRRRAAVLLAGGDRGPARARAGADLVRRGAPLAPRRVLPGARAGRRRRDGGRLPGGDAAAAGDELHLQPRRAAAVPADDLQGGAAARARDRVPGGLGVARMRAARWPGGARSSSCWPRSRAGRWCAGRRWTRSCPGTRSPPRGRRRPTTSTGRRARTAGRSCSRASCTPTTTGAAPSTPSCPRWPTAPSPSATRCPTPTCAPSTCCGRSTGSCSSGARCPASSARCWT